VAFRELAAKIDLPEGATDRYRRLEALERQLTGELYDHLKYSFETEKTSAGKYIPIRERAPSTDFNLAYEITHDTLAELFGDEQFPVVKVVRDREESDDATEEVAAMIESVGIDCAVSESYEEGVVGAVAMVLHRSDEGAPFYEILPAKWCEPIYASKFSRKLLMLTVTYPIDREQVDEMFPNFTRDNADERGEIYWFRYVVGPVETVTYYPMLAAKFANLGEKDAQGKVIEFTEFRRDNHGFYGRTPALYTKNLGGKQREIDGMALWWPIRNMCIDIDYTLSQASRGLRYCSDPMLFVRRGDMDSGGMGDMPAGMEKPAGNMATQTADDGSMVRGATQVLVGGEKSDAKILEISAQGITEEREFVKDLREYALEVVGGMKARAEHVKGAASGTAIDKQSKPLRRLVRRQRRPYGKMLLLDVIDLTLYGYRMGVFDPSRDFDIAKIPDDASTVLEWPNDETLQGQELFYHVQGVQLAAGGSVQRPLELIDPPVMGAKLAADIGMHEPYASIKGDCVAPELAAPALPAPAPKKPSDQS